MNSNAKQIFYGVMAVVGICVTWYFNLQAIGADPNFDYSAFVSDNYVNPSSASIFNDILVVVFVYWFWSFFEARKLGMKHWWIHVPLTIFVAIAFSFPLFLLLRERALNREDLKQAN